MEKKKISTKEYLQFFIVMTVILGSLATFVYYRTQERKKDVKEIFDDYSLTKGIITKVSFYKGKNIRVRYKVDGKNIDGGNDIKELMGKNVGDSLWIKYSNKNPEKFITELSVKYR
ncbi:hypothetical protein [Chryseobacterium sp. Leaf201]|uniref:hypothetical protein n=1 Tax=Chryseobacterium sp. Leaf201 TaxID=1735672 RepID=UPI000701A118|nr:hypothetical protein [Chryseobacterium sp. Leaf201]KQM20733.1 hypothetical protein ASE55_18435 [Chryseobacterium sp. Leaf201]